MTNKAGSAARSPQLQQIQRLFHAFAFLQFGAVTDPLVRQYFIACHTTDRNHKQKKRNKNKISEE